MTPRDLKICRRVALHLLEPWPLERQRFGGPRKIHVPTALRVLQQRAKRDHWHDSYVFQSLGRSRKKDLKLSHRHERYAFWGLP